MLERSEEQFPELPMQWRDHGYEIDQRLGKGAYGAVYRLVKNRGAEKKSRPLKSFHGNWERNRFVNMTMT